MIPLTPASLLVRLPDLTSAEMDGDLVMLNVERGEYFGLSGVGRRVWELLAQPTTVDQITAAIFREFNVDEATCHRDMLVFAEELLANGMAKVC